MLESLAERPIGGSYGRPQHIQIRYEEGFRDKSSFYILVYIYCSGSVSWIAMGAIIQQIVRKGAIIQQIVRKGAIIQ